MVQSYFSNVDELQSIFAFSRDLKRFSKAKMGYAYYRYYRHNLITGEREAWPIKQWLESLTAHKLWQDFTFPRVIHLCYEIGYLLNSLEHMLDHPELADCLLAVEVIYSHEESVKDLGQYSKLNLKPIKSPDFETYNQLFQCGREHLLRGDCYQFNLTCDYEFKVQGNWQENYPYVFLKPLWEKNLPRPAFGHFTHLSELNLAIMSNSPECLFQAKKVDDGMVLWTRPIKGTQALTGKSKKDLKQAWEILSSSKKNEAELFMISDLLRNDLSRIEHPIAKVIKTKAPLLVPGLMHQYSLLSVKLSPDVHLKQVLSAMFPGGSITGAPKNRVMEILWELEKRPRGMYCGSTILLYKDIRAACINIRTAELNLNSGHLSYGAGGGITVLSESYDEFQEMGNKVRSFVGIFDKD